MATGPPAIDGHDLRLTGLVLDGIVRLAGDAHSAAVAIRVRVVCRPRSRIQGVGGGEPRKRNELSRSVTRSPASFEDGVDRFIDMASARARALTLRRDGHPYGMGKVGDSVLVVHPSRITYA